jgi:hypothetical protein
LPTHRPRLAVAASAAYPNLLVDWPLLRHALGAEGVDASTEVWTDPDVRWPTFDLVVANGARDNIHRPDEFLRWSLDKRYLAALAAAGVPTVPTTWLEPDHPIDPETDLALPHGEFVIKPAISGGGFETARYGDGETGAARAHLGRLLDAGRTVMIQPYQAAVDTLGEVGLVFLAGQFNHMP